MRGIRASPSCPGLKLSTSKVCIVFWVSVVMKRSAADSEDATENVARSILTTLW